MKAIGPRVQIMVYNSHIDFIFDFIMRNELDWYSENYSRYFTFTPSAQINIDRMIKGMAPFCHQGLVEQKKQKKIYAPGRQKSACGVSSQPSRTIKILVAFVSHTKP